MSVTNLTFFEKKKGYLIEPYRSLNCPVMDEYSNLTRLFNGHTVAKLKTPGDHTSRNAKLQWLLRSISSRAINTSTLETWGKKVLDPYLQPRIFVCNCHSASHLSGGMASRVLFKGEKFSCSPSPGGRWRTEKNGRNWLWSPLWCPNVPRGYGIGEGGKQK